MGGLLMNEEHIKWAAQHDWYIGHGVNSENTLFVRVREWQQGFNTYMHVQFTDYQALRAWAGY